MNKKIVITIAGGSRGLGKCLLDRFSNAGYDKAAFHRASKIKNIKNFYIDLDTKNSIDDIRKNLLDLIKNTNYEKYSIHFVSGGSLRINIDNDDVSSIERVLKHNFTIPASLTSTLRNYSEKNKKNLELLYYSSAATKNLKASPYYVAAKSALENFFKSSLRIKPINCKMYLLRLGFVDIQHKYFHELSKNNPEKFYDVVINEIPSRHFANPSEISDFALKISESGNIMDGMITDLSGGHSWK